MPAQKLSDLVIPRIETERLVVTLLRPSLAALMVRFRLENQRHLTFGSLYARRSFTLNHSGKPNYKPI